MADYKLIENRLLLVLSLLVDVFSESEVNEVQEFIDVGEYGLALDTLIDIINEESKTIPLAVVSLVGETAAAMGWDSSDVKERLLEFVA